MGSWYAADGLSGHAWQRACCVATGKSFFSRTCRFYFVILFSFRAALPPTPDRVALTAEKAFSAFAKHGAKCFGRVPEWTLLRTSAEVRECYPCAFGRPRRQWSLGPNGFRTGARRKRKDRASCTGGEGASNTWLLTEACSTRRCSIARPSNVYSPMRLTEIFRYDAETLDTQVRTHTTAGARTLRSRDYSPLPIGQQMEMHVVGAWTRSAIFADLLCFMATRSAHSVFDG